MTRDRNRFQPPSKLAFTVSIAMLLASGAAHAAVVALVGLSGSDTFGTHVAVLPNGNIVVTDPYYDALPFNYDVGAAYLFRPDGTLISTLVGGTAESRVGLGGITVLGTGNYLIQSPFWRNGELANAGAVTFGSSTHGVSGVVSAENSLIGSSVNDGVGQKTTLLTNGNFVITTPRWMIGTVFSAGAATFGSGLTGVRGEISAANSLIGRDGPQGDGPRDTIALSNGNYVVLSPSWGTESVPQIGAVTFGSGVTGITGPISSANSLVGTQAEDLVGYGGVLPLTNGNYVVRSPNWANGPLIFAGAATFGSGTSGITGLVSPTNSLVGARQGDSVGETGAVALGNGNYVVLSPSADSATASNVGAVTFGSGTTGVSGLVSEANSLVGSTSGDGGGISTYVVELLNGDYVVAAPYWDDGAIENVGAVTFASGSSGIGGVVSRANSLVGSSRDDRVGAVLHLGNGNYVVNSPNWDDGSTIDAGAVTFVDRKGATSGVVSAANSLIGSRAGDQVGRGRVAALTNGNYVVSSPFWDHGELVDAGAATFGSGSIGITGTISPTNSLVGGRSYSLVGSAGTTALQNGNYVVVSPNWHSDSAFNVGAATFGSGVTGVHGLVSSANSLVGSRPQDAIGLLGVTSLSNGNYVVNSPNWDNLTSSAAGAVTFGSGTTGISGLVSPENSLVGTNPFDWVGDFPAVALSNGGYVIHSQYLFWRVGGITLAPADGTGVGTLGDVPTVFGGTVGQGSELVFSYDAYRNQLVVGQRMDNRVTLLRPGIETTIDIVGDSPDPSGGGEPVIFTAAVSTSSSAATDGRVTFVVSSGETCVDSTPTAISATTVTFSCSFAFTNDGTVSVVAEYTGSLAYAYSGSAPEVHTIIADRQFGNGFETP